MNDLDYLKSQLSMVTTYKQPESTWRTNAKQQHYKSIGKDFVCIGKNDNGKYWVLHNGKFKRHKYSSLADAKTVGDELLANTDFLKDVKINYEKEKTTTRKEKLTDQCWKPESTN